MPFNTSNGMPCSSLWNQMKWSPSSDQVNKFIKYQNLLKTWNQKINLTRLIDGQDFWVLQVFDSLWPFEREINNQNKKYKFIDIGSGCGVPGIVLAIAMINSEFVLVESIKKKAIALESIVKGLDLDNRVKVINNRAEVVGQNKNYRGSFDFALARAVGKISVVAEYLVPLVIRNGSCFIYRGKLIEDNESKFLNQTLSLLNSEVNEIKKINLPFEKGERNIIKIKPNNICPDTYPRKVGLPSKKPLSK